MSASDVARKPLTAKRLIAPSNKACRVRSPFVKANSLTAGMVAKVTELKA